MDYNIPILGSAQCGHDYQQPDPTWPTQYTEDFPLIVTTGAAPQWYDESDATFGTTVWLGDARPNHLGEGFTGILFPAYCTIAPFDAGPVVSSITVQIRARVRPKDPHGNPPADNPCEVLFAVYNTDPNSLRPNEVAAYSRPVSDQARGSSYFKFVPSWEPSWQEAELPAYRWNWAAFIGYDENGNEIWGPPGSYSNAHTYLAEAFRHGARIQIGQEDDNGAPGYTERWIDVYEVRIVAHSPRLDGNLTGERRAFKGMRR